MKEQEKHSYGLKIKNYQAAVLYEMNLGVREKIDSIDAMLMNSLLLDFLKDHGLKTINGDRTRDVICLRFGFGTMSYESKVRQLNSKKKKLLKSYEESSEDKEIQKKLKRINKLIKRADKNKRKYEEHSRNELREIVYQNGISITYRDGEVIHYKVAYRSAGKAKVGEIMAIRDELYDEAINFLHMGIVLPDQSAPIVELQAYASLISSSIIGKVKIKPEEILVIPDVERSMTTNILSVETDENNHCTVNRRDNYPLKNVLFDGQALIDVSIFPEWANDFVLLRHHFTKCAAFATRIQLYFQDVFKDEYETKMLTDYWGRQIRAKDVKLITTENALKWVKFGVSFEEWAEWVRKNGYEFGVVKTAHESKIGYGLQRASYQMVNSFDLSTMEDTVKDSVQYIGWMKKDDEFFLDYLNKKKSFVNDYELLLKLVEQDPMFIDSEYFAERRQNIISKQVQDFKLGKVLLNAENLVVVGSPYAMLLASVGKNPDNDNTFGIEKNAIQCYTTRFEENEYLGEMRSPFNGLFNMGLMHNVRHPNFERYFAFGKLVVAINMIGTEAQPRNNGMDQDSDMVYVTNNPCVVEQAKYCMGHYPTIENNVQKETSHYRNTMLDMAKVDNKIAAGQMDIGLSSNVCQICLTYSYNFSDQKYLDYMAILSVLAHLGQF